MKEERVALSPKELQRVRVIGLLADGRISNQEAAERLGICGRQIIRLKKKYAEQGDVGLIHGNRGRAPKGRIGDDVRSLVLGLYQEKYLRVISSPESRDPISHMFQRSNLSLPN